jgi:hypothetical protein
MKLFTITGLIAGVALLAASFSHYLGGWGSLAPELAASQLAPDTVGTLWAGWLFGSFALFLTGLMVVAEAVRQLGGQSCNRLTVSSIALLYAGFGLTAWVVRDFNPHFLAFIATGALIAALLPGRPQCSEAQRRPPGSDR